MVHSQCQEDKQDTGEVVFVEERLWRGLCWVCGLDSLALGWGRAQTTRAPTPSRLGPLSCKVLFVGKHLPNLLLEVQGPSHGSTREPRFSTREPLAPLVPGGHCSLPRAQTTNLGLPAPPQRPGPAHTAEVRWAGKSMPGRGPHCSTEAGPTIWAKLGQWPPLPSLMGPQATCAVLSPTPHLPTLFLNPEICLCAM